MNSLDKAMWIGADAGEIALVGILLFRRVLASFPVFTTYILWQVATDIFLYVILQEQHGYATPYFVHIYYGCSLLADLLELGVLLEIAANVLRPANRILTNKIILGMLGIIILLGFVSFLGTESITKVVYHNPRILVVIDTTAAILRLATFLAVAGFSQILGLNWKSHVLQLTTGLAFYAVIDLIGQLAKSQIHPGPSYDIYYHLWSEFDVAGYLCTVYFWCWAFWKKEAPRRDFSPKMAKFLASLSGSAKRQNAVLARSRNE